MSGTWIDRAGRAWKARAVWVWGWGWEVGKATTPDKDVRRVRLRGVHRYSICCLLAVVVVVQRSRTPVPLPSLLIPTRLLDWKHGMSCCP